MKFLSQAELNRLDALAQERRNAIRSAPDCIEITGTTYYVSAEGSDENDGKTPGRAWKTLKKVSETRLLPGDGVRFRRGDLFRGSVQTYPGVTYAAFGVGEKPKFYGWDRDLADPSLWELYDAEHAIWRLKDRMPDVGTLVMNDGEAHSRKLIPSYIGGRFVCRDDETREFDMAAEMTRDLDLFCLYSERLTCTPTAQGSFPVPMIDEESCGVVFLRCDRGNPGAVFTSIEALPRRPMFRVGSSAGVTLENLCLKYIGLHAVAAGGHTASLHVIGCEIGWIGGTVQHYLGTDPNNPKCGRGSVTRFGNGVEIYGGCEDYLVKDCYLYQIYDAAITHQITTCGKRYLLSGIRYEGNLIENCVYGIEYFLERTGGDTESLMEDCVMCGNIIRFSGYGWGQQRPNKDTPAHIKGWSHENTARDFCIRDNILDRSAYRLVHLVAKERESCPLLTGNTYIQTLGGTLGQYGSNRDAEPENLPFDEGAENAIAERWGESGATVLGIKPELPGQSRDTGL